MLDSARDHNLVDDEDEEDLQTMLMSITEMETTVKKHKLDGMKAMFPMIPEATIQEHLNLDEDRLFDKLLALSATTTTQGESSTSGKRLPAPNFTAAEQQAINPEEIKEDMLKQALWAELLRRQDFVEKVSIPRTNKEETDISMFLRDAFPTIRMYAINELVHKRDFYQCILIFRLVEMGWIDRLKKYEFIPERLTPVQIEANRIALRVTEAKGMHHVQLPQMAKQMWLMYEEIVNFDYSSEILQLTRFDCPVCFDTFNNTDGIVCRRFATTDDNHIEHQFCKECVRQHAITSATEMTMGPGGCGVKCLEIDCAGIILTYQFEQLLSEDQKKLIDQRVAEAALQEAKLENMVSCQRCTFAAIVEDAQKQPVFYCQNPKCNHKHCRLCNKEYDEKHMGRACDEIESAIDKARKQKEEELTKLVIRTCPGCGTGFEKNGGCHVMTCSNCRLTQCYVCRQTGIDHGHLNRCQQMSDEQVRQRDEQQRLEAIRAGQTNALIKDQVDKLR